MRKFVTKIASRQNSVNQYLIGVLAVLVGVLAVLVGVLGVFCIGDGALRTWDGGSGKKM